MLKRYLFGILQRSRRHGITAMILVEMMDSRTDAWVGERKVGAWQSVKNGSEKEFGGKKIQ